MIKQELGAVAGKAQDNDYEQVLMNEALLANIEVENYLSFLEKQRQTTLYQQLLAKLNQGQKIKELEIFYFACITNNILLLSSIMLQDCRKLSLPPEHKLNLEVMLAALEYHEAINMEVKQEANQHFMHASQVRHKHTWNNKTYFLNLSGANLNNINLPKTNLIYTNLSHANLTSSKLNDTKFPFCILNHANLAEAFGEKVSFYFALAKHANFTKSNFINSTVEAANLRESILKEVRWYHCCFKETNMAEVDSSAAVLSAISLAETGSGPNLNHARLLNTDLSQFNIREAHLEQVEFFSWPAVENPNILNEELTQLQTLLPKYNIEDRKKILLLAAENILAMAALLNNNLPKKLNFLNIAIGHAIFQPANLAKRTINYMERKAQIHACGLYKRDFSHVTTPALNLLETEKNLVSEAQKLRKYQ